MRQSWRDLLFAHWPLPIDAVRPLVPPAFGIDAFAGEAWISIVPFRMANVRPARLPALPWLSAFPELNVRTYVTALGPTGIKPGVFFFSLDAANPVAVAIARRFFHLPYYRAEIHHAPWPLQTAEAEIIENTVAAAGGVTLPDVAPRLHFSRRLDVLVWPLRPLAA